MSGRATSVARMLTRARRSSAGGAVAVVSDMGRCAVAAQGVGGNYATHPRSVASGSARALLGERLDLGGVRLVDDAGAGQHRLATADSVRVRDVEHREDDRQVALEVLLLVDRE